MFSIAIPSYYTITSLIRSDFWCTKIVKHYTPLKSSHSSNKAHIFIAEVTLQEKIYCKWPLVTVTDNLDRLILNRKSLIQSVIFPMSLMLTIKNNFSTYIHLYG
jgi:hypothetical protein